MRGSLLTMSRCFRCQDGGGVSARHYRDASFVRQSAGQLWLWSSPLPGVPPPPLPPAPVLSLPEGHRPDHGDRAVPAGVGGLRLPRPRPGQLPPGVPGAGVRRRPGLSRPVQAGHPRVGACPQ